MIGGGSIEAVALAVKAVAEAADVPDEVKISRDNRKRARVIRNVTRRLHEALGRVETIRPERRTVLVAAIMGYAAELRAMGVAVELPDLDGDGSAG